MCKTFFISTPIAGFNDEKQYLEYRKILGDICNNLKAEFGERSTYAAFLDVADYDSYDLPEDSAKIDLEQLQKADCMILFYPIKVVTSALTELGVALGLNKKVLLVVPNIQILPYMVQGIPALIPNRVKLIEANIEDRLLANRIIEVIKNI